MTKILSAGETLKCGETRWDETGRFCLFMQPDGNLVIYAHLLEPQPRLIATGHTHTYGWGEGVDLVLRKDGRLYLKKQDGHLAALYYPDKDIPHSPPIPYAGNYPESTLHLQADGNLCLYFRDPPEAGRVHFSMGTLIHDLMPSKPVNPNAGIFNSGALQINIRPDSATTSIDNQSGRPLECFGANGQRVLIQNGGSVPASCEPGAVGTLSLPLWPGLPTFTNGNHTPGTGSDDATGVNASTEFRFPEAGKSLVIFPNERGDGLRLG